MSIVWEQRWHPLREEWVLYTSHRAGRPWIGQTHAAEEKRPPSHDPACALCPGVKRLNGTFNPSYTGAWWFTNDLPTFGGRPDVTGDDFYQARPALGTAEVVCYHPDHAKTFVDLNDAEAVAVVELWTNRYRELGARPEIDHVLIFENKGALVGTSNPHPHCQIYAGNMVYGTIAREDAAARRHRAQTGRFLGRTFSPARRRGRGS